MALENLRGTLDAAQAVMEERLGTFRPEVGLILGSGLGVWPSASPILSSFPSGEVPGMGVSTANGHVGRFVAGMLGGRRVLAMQGRLHGYEGYTAQEVAFPVWLMAALGADMLITTNAAGAINEGYRVGDFCIMTDQLNFTGRNPITGTEPDAMAPRFFSMLDAYDPVTAPAGPADCRGAGHSRARGRVSGAARPLLRDAGGDSDVPLLGR